MRRWRRPSAALALSLVLHVVLGAGILALLIMPHTAANWLHLTRGEPAVVERIGFIAMPKTGAETNPGKAGGDNRPVSKTKPKELVAPQETPNALPTAPATPTTPAQPEGGAGKVIGQGGATEGVAPIYSDPRPWVPPARVPTAPKTVPQRYDSALAGMVKTYNDSLAAMGKEREPGDWTFGKNKDWGINQKWIKLGPVQLPTALLGLLPLNATGNPVLGQREAQLNAMHSDIAYHAQQAMNEDQFRQAVKELRQRKDRERQLQQNQKPKDDNTAPTLANSGQHDPVIPQP
ncbi:MAG TPA: hypothetical protein VK807_19105 [Gemmatimonadaceae bacterium]|jgi:hypothetical protein|nr:hypothetical protein [Gemmatimonadaceae bacterium]